MSVGEKNHAPARPACNIICFESPWLCQEAALRMEVKSVDDSVRPRGLVPTLLVCSASPRLEFPGEPPKTPLYERAQAYIKAIMKNSEYFARSQVFTSFH